MRPLDETGFSLVEVVVAVTMAALLLMAGAQVLGNSLKTIVYARSDSQSAELVSETIERLRNADYAAVAMVAADIVGDPDIGGTPTVPTFDPDGDGPLLAEPVVVSAGGIVAPHIVTSPRNAQAYELATYVTTPSDSEVSTAAYKRVTVRATWTSGSLTHTRQTSTYITSTRRGLPLPNFQVVASAGTNDAPILAIPGEPLSLPFTVINRGARDAFNLSITSAPTAGMAFDLDIDDDLDGAVDDLDVAAGDSDSDGQPDTGLMEVDAVMGFVATGDVPPTAVPGDYVFTVTGRSIGQPDAGGATKSDTFNVTIGGEDSCDGCTFEVLYPRNVWPSCATEPCSSTTQVDMPLRSESPTAASLANFDTDVDVAAGRTVARSATTPAWSATGSTVANWRYQVPTSTVLQGNVLVDLYVAVPGTGGSPGTNVETGVRVYVNRSTTGSGSTEPVGEALGWLPLSLTSGYRYLQVSVPVDTTIAKNRFVEIKVVVDSPTSTTGIWLGYDAVTHPSVVRLPVQ